MGYTLRNPVQVVQVQSLGLGGLHFKVQKGNSTRFKWLDDLQVAPARWYKQTVEWNIFRLKCFRKELPNGTTSQTVSLLLFNQSNLSNLEIKLRREPAQSLANAYRPFFLTFQLGYGNSHATVC